MATQRERIAAYREALVGTGVKPPIRMRFSTKDALALSSELAPEEVRHPEALVKGLTAIEALIKPEADDAEGLIAYGVSLGKAADLFWEAFEGQTVEDVEIIRSR